MFILAAFKVGE